jgi:hypothetical protein
MGTEEKKKNKIRSSTKEILKKPYKNKKTR